MLDPTLYRVNGTPVTIVRGTQSNADNDDGQLVNEISVRDRTVTITMSKAFVTGSTTIEVVAGAKIGAWNDQRTLAAATETVVIAAPARDRQGPVVEIIGVQGQSTFDVLVTDASGLLEASSAANNSKYIFGGNDSGFLNVYVDTDPGNNDAKNDEPAGFTATQPGSFGRPCAAGTTCLRLRFDADTQLAAGHEIRVKANTFKDAADNGHRQAIEEITAPTSTFKITGVSIGNVTPTADASATITSNGSDMKITARSAGVAAGAMGNDWRVFGYEHASFAAATRADIDVFVDTRYQRIVYTLKAGTTFAKVTAVSPTLFDLASSLRGNDDFDANFTVSYSGNQTDKYDDLATTIPSGIPFAGGTSSVTLRVDFNDYAVTVGDETGTLANAIGGSDATSVDFVARDRMAHFTWIGADVSALPQAGGARVIPAGAATNTSGGSALLILRQLRQGL